MKRKKLTNKEILNVLYKAKDIFNNQHEALCFCISEAYINIYQKDIKWNDVPNIIPKFNRKFLNVKHYGNYWWDIDDINSRNQALDKLIEYYSCNTIKDKFKFYIKYYFKK